MPANRKYTEEQRKEATDLYWKGKGLRLEGERPRGDYTLREIQDRTGVEFRSILKIVKSTNKPKRCNGNYEGAKMNQTEQIHHHLQFYGSITSLEAAMDYKIMCLAERIRDLRDKGIEVKTMMEKNGKKKWARYHL